MKPIRVLHMIGSLNIGGSQSMVINLYHNIDREKIQFDFVIDRPEETYYKETVEALGARIYVMPGFNGRNILEIKKAWKTFFAEHPEYQILHSHVRSYASVILPVAKKCGVKTVIHSHSTSNGSGVSALVKALIQYPLRYQADYFLGCSHKANEWLFGSKVAGDTSRCSVLKNGIDLKKYSYDPAVRAKYRAELQLEDRLVFGTVGRVETPKNPLFILDVFAEIVSRSPEACFLWVGDGAMMPAVKEKAAQLGVEDKIRFVGSRSNVADYLQAMDVFLFPSLWEGLGISLIEAQATGLPCVCSDAIPEEAYVTDMMIKKYLTEPADAWAEACLSAVPQSRESRHAQIREANYDIEQVVEQLRGVYGLYSGDAAGTQS